MIHDGTSRPLGINLEERAMVRYLTARELALYCLDLDECLRSKLTDALSIHELPNAA